MIAPVREAPTLIAERVEMDPTAMLGPRPLGSEDEDLAPRSRAWMDALIQACQRRFEVGPPDESAA